MSNLLQKMSRDLLIPLDDLRYLVRSAPHRYKVYQIKKRQAGQMRTIAQPAREIKALQYWVIANILRRFPVHQAAMAYRKGKGILNNAKPHAKKRFLLKLDFEDFFHSIKAGDLIKLFERTQPSAYNAYDLECLSRILFWRMGRVAEPVLSIGAPSSPVLSNILMCDFDRSVAEFCRSATVTYTRYADDLTFSANKRDVLRTVEAEVIRICANLSSPRLRLNNDKTVHASKATSRRVTGLILSNDGAVSIGHGRKRDLHAAVHRFKLGKLSEVEMSALAGTLAFVNSVEPQFLRVLARRYGKSTMKRLFALNRTAQEDKASRMGPGDE